jgi:hypothetical protein
MMTLSRKKKTIENKYTMYSERHITGIPNIFLVGKIDVGPRLCWHILRWIE